jgi:radical SAM superfamily enzyme YgiQ (UPF0313 family)
MRVLLITPPMTQINTPYPATAYLTAYLRSEGYICEQRDMSLDFALQLYSRDGLEQILEELKKENRPSESVQFFLEASKDYLATINPVVRFLQGQDSSLALRIAEHLLLPEGPRFLPLSQHSELIESFGNMGLQDKAKYLASLYLDDIADVVRDGIDSDFALSRYAEELASSQFSFTPLYTKLIKKTSLLDTWIQKITDRYLTETRPDIVGFTWPFPGNVYAGLKSAQHIKQIHKNIKIFAGGGFVNTELRELTDPRVFEFIDALTYDDGEKPLKNLLEHFANKRPREKLLRTKMLSENTQQPKVLNYNSPEEKDPAFKTLVPPTYDGLPLTRYISMLELPNPVHRLWSDFRWNKLILAHGCYWKKCTFCDIHLDYIGRFEPQAAKQVVDHIEKIMQETGQSGFHFVDEAAPPALLKAMSQEILNRDLKITFWGNIRFDKQFTAETCQLLADAGCVAVTGGLEVASPRLLELINKGVTLQQVEEVTLNFQNAGIYVHAYLMYGFPTQTKKETIESLENVRQLFKKGCLQSAHWHRFVATAHSPVGKCPEKFNIQITKPKMPKEGLFAQYALPFEDAVKTDHTKLGKGLTKALYNYMHGIGLDKKTETWFR